MARSVDVTRYRFDIAETWDGRPVPPSQIARVDFWIASAEGQAEIRIDAPFLDDPKPEAPAGRLDGLWEYEVVELVLLGEQERYLELEFGPHGHWLALAFQHERRPDPDSASVGVSEIEIPFKISISEQRWQGRASIPADWLPPGLHAANAFRIEGRPDERRYFAAHGAPGPQPDFHQLARFASLKSHLRLDE